MPLYEFRCSACNALFERLVSVDVKQYACPICQKDCLKVVSQIAPPIIKDNSPYQQRPTMSSKELDHRIGETVEKKIRPVFDEREKAKKTYRQNVKEQRLKRLSTGASGTVEYVPADDATVKGRKVMLKEFDDALLAHRKRRNAQGLPQFDDSKK